MSKVVIGTVTWNGLEYNKQCLGSLFLYLKPSYNLCVWDNASTDGTKEYLQKVFEINSEFMRFVPSETNQYMCIPWNFILDWAFKSLKADYCMIADNDIKFTSTVNNIIPFMEKYPEFGLVSSNILNKSISTDDAEIKARELSDDTFKMDELLNPLTCISKECFEVSGYYDINLPIAFQDSEYFHRVRKSGFGAVVYNGSWIWHKSNVSTSKVPSEEYLKNKAYYERIYEERGYSI